MAKKKNSPVISISGPARRSTRRVAEETEKTQLDEQPLSVPEETDRLATLRVNRNTNPGVADVPRPRRSPEEVAKERQEKEDLQKADAVRRQKSIQKAASIEDVLIQKEHKLKSQDVSEGLEMQRKKRTRQVDSEEVTDLDKTATHSDIRVAKKKKESASANQTSDGNDLSVQSNDHNELADIHDISSGSGSDGDYVDDKEAEVESEDTDDNGGLDDDDEMAAGGQRKGNRKENRGKLREKSESSKAAKVKKCNINGIQDNWKSNSYEEQFSDDPVLQGGDSLPPSSTASGVSSNAEDDDVDEENDGISSDDEERVERSRMASSAMPRPRKPSTSVTSTHALAKVEPTTSVPTYIPPNTLEIQLKKKQDIRSRKDLPPALKLSFDEQFSPKIRELIGIAQPWDRLSEEKVHHVWSDVFPDVSLNGWLKTVVMKLVDDNISNWRAKLAKTAVDYFEKSVIQALEDKSKGGVSEWCNWALSGDYKCRPFYYSSYVEGSEHIEAKGIFQHPLVSATLAYHYSSISAIHPDVRLKDYPVGALVLAIQASHRAISRWLTGEFLDIKRPLQDFSKDNWGDNPTRNAMHYPSLQPGVIQESKATSQLLRVVKKLSDKRWEKITGSALSAIRRQKVVTVQPPLAQATVDEEHSDFSLVDNDSN